jgi:hypothetical protein
MRRPKPTCKRAWVVPHERVREWLARLVKGEKVAQAMICACCVIMASRAARPAAVNGFPRPPDTGIGDDPVDGGDVLHDVGVVNLRVLCQQAVHHRDTDAGADVARKAVEAGAFRPWLVRQRRQSHRAEWHEDETRRACALAQASRPACSRFSPVLVK